MNQKYILHPDWQLKLAKIIVLLSKELDINFYINSHSPQFISFINVFSVFYKIDEEVNYYLTENSDEEHKFNVKDLKGNIKEIFDQLGHPYRDIAEIKGKVDARKVIERRDEYKI